MPLGLPIRPNDQAISARAIGSLLARSSVPSSSTSGSPPAVPSVLTAANSTSASGDDSASPRIRSDPSDRILAGTKQRAEQLDFGIAAGGPKRLDRRQLDIGIGRRQRLDQNRMSAIKGDVVEQLRRMTPRNLVGIANRTPEIRHPARVAVVSQCRGRAQSNVNILVDQRLLEHRYRGRVMRVA